MEATIQIALSGVYSKGYFTTVSLVDYYKVRDIKWYVRPDNQVYGWVNGKVTRLHRFIMCAPDGIQVDHRDLNRLNNTRGNLRLANHSTQQMNTLKRTRLKNNLTSKYKGVSIHSRSGRYRARIFHNKDEISLGMFNTQEEAAREYNKYALKYFGEFAKLNEVPE